MMIIKNNNNNINDDDDDDDDDDTKNTENKIALTSVSWQEMKIYNQN